MTDPAAISARIRDFLTGELNSDRDPAELDPNQDLFEQGWIDSIGFLKLVAFLEETFGLIIEDDHLFDDRFLSLTGQGELIAELIAGQNGDRG